MDTLHLTTSTDWDNIERALRNRTACLRNRRHTHLFIRNLRNEVAKLSQAEVTIRTAPGQPTRRRDEIIASINEQLHSVDQYLFLAMLGQ